MQTFEKPLPTKDQTSVTAHSSVRADVDLRARMAKYATEHAEKSSKLNMRSLPKAQRA